MDSLKKLKRITNDNLLKEIKTLANIPETLEDCNILSNLCGITFSKLTSTLDSIQKETEIKFDLNKISNETIGNEKLIGKIKFEIG